MEVGRDLFTGGKVRQDVCSREDNQDPFAPTVNGRVEMELTVMKAALCRTHQMPVLKHVHNVVPKLILPHAEQLEFGGQYLSIGRIVMPPEASHLRVEFFAWSASDVVLVLPGSVALFADEEGRQVRICRWEGKDSEGAVRTASPWN